MSDSHEHLVDLDAYLKDLHVVGDDDHKADVLLLTCLDFRFFVKISNLMKDIKYDHVVLAGAALGGVVQGKEHWHQTFLDHVDLAVKLHEVPAILVMQHRDCGAFGPKGFGLLPENPTRKEERQAHREQAALLGEKVPRFLGYKALLLDVPRGADVVTCDQMI
ncbi:MAG TPA: hypothetical protein VFX97_12295 [Pyrinomonadaceae bacterium]|nr:hypothetical protein [Pyrinomonadaceae bacterium]